ncbi:MAG: hypothetical protein ABIF11_07850 [Nitrospirota bacterium]
MKNMKDNLKQELCDLEKARDVLHYSYKKCHAIELIDGLSYEEQESFEALTGRFARLSDLIIQRIFRLLDILDLEDEGTIRDRINRAEKKGVVHSADDFIEIRILRNEIAHEYKAETIYTIFEKVLGYTPKLLESVETIADYAQRYFKEGGSKPG